MSHRDPKTPSRRKTALRQGALILAAAAIGFGIGALTDDPEADRDEGSSLEATADERYQQRKGQRRVSFSTLALRGCGEIRRTRLEAPRFIGMPVDDARSELRAIGCSMLIVPRRDLVTQPRSRLRVAVQTRDGRIAHVVGLR